MNDKNLLTDQHLSELLEEEAGKIDSNLDLWPLIQQQLKTTQTSFESVPDNNSLLLEPVTTRAGTGPKPLLTFPRVTKFLLGIAAVLALAFVVGAALLPGKTDLSNPASVVNLTVPATPHAVTGTLKATLTGNTAAVRTLVWNPDGSRLISSADNDNGDWNFWDPTSKSKEIMSFPGISRPLVWPYWFRWTPEGRILGFSSGDGQVFSPDGKLMADRISNSEYQLKKADDPTVVKTPAPTVMPGKELQKPDGSVLATLSIPGGVISQLAWSPDGKFIAGSGQTVESAGPGDIRAWLWRADGKLITSIDDFHFPITSIAWKPDSQSVAFAAKGNVLAEIWSTEGKLLNKIGGDFVIWFLAWSPDGRTLAAGCSDNMVRLWPGNWITEVDLAGHQDTVWVIAWSPDGKTLASGSGDKTIKLWAIK